jgi:tRNA pseudouridine13 synthase
VSDDIQANRFNVVVRKLTVDQAPSALKAVEEVRCCGLPNYFDDQRFGSVGSEGAFLARALLHGRYEEALRAALAAPYEFDRAPQKKVKALVRKQWGEWSALKDQLPRGHDRSLISYLADHPQDFRGALAWLRPELRGLYLSAYQSHLWNRMLALWLRARLPAEQLFDVPLKLGPAPMPRRLSEQDLGELRDLRLPLHHARLRLDDADPCKPFFDQVLADDGVTQEQFKLPGLRGMFFSKGDRAAWCMPANLRAEVAEDELHAGKMKLTLRFELTRGSYATLVIKRVQNIETT